MKKIPVKIVEYTINGETRKNVMIDMVDTYDISGDVEKRINNFKKRYFKLVEKAKKNMPKERTGKTSSAYWKIGNMFKTFNENVKDVFEITNFAEELERDFGLSYRYVQELIIFAELFKKEEIDDSISISMYRAFVWKKNQLQEIGQLNREKKRLMKRAKSHQTMNYKIYQKELTELVKSKTQ